MTAPPVLQLYVFVVIDNSTGEESLIIWDNPDSPQIIPLLSADPRDVPFLQALAEQYARETDQVVDLRYFELADTLARLIPTSDGQAVT